jgi:predicted short-subunit dehydrogenase-like oxidoreductase (DUF2520 family)
MRELGWRIGAVVTRNQSSARRAVRFIGAGTALVGLSRRVLASTCVLIATPDGAIEEIANELARIGGQDLQGQVVLHTSGAMDSSVLHAARSCGASVGSMHPLQTFNGVTVPPLEGKVFAIEGDPVAVRTARKIARALGAAPSQIDARNKPLYHAAGALAAGHTLVVVEAAIQLLMSLGMKRTEAMRALLPMTKQVLQNYERLGPRAAWTGPLARGDYEVVAKHLNVLQQYSEEYRDAYDALNRLAEVVLAHDAANDSPSVVPVGENKRAKAQYTGGKG